MADELRRQIDAFHMVFLKVEEPSPNIEAVKSTVQVAFQITADGFSLPLRLKAAGLPSSTMDNREVREINKIANYWRIC